ncbi:prepilin-type N-terminal cleavage/methylation domain-containing protein [Vogesella fluminis]|uniref:Type IV pilus modification protein PilV n=1 Tax=Vogesella fluminis TaxID=1069161 RepID=A0ABQ3HD39_9NEIS|nr:prepilin-type N-terminal cleavage/methylation domain-containing protein [Vogesella fluminis]GHD76122.1 hypothetical protein GCM10011419_14980 [Vogesella fluminis]
MRRSQRGISLIEVLVTMLVLAFGVLALVRMQGYLYHSQISANDYNAATTLAQNALEQRHAGLNGPDDLCTKSSFDSPLPDASGSLARFKCQSTTAGSQTTVTVRWDDSTGTMRQISLSAPTLLTDS